MSSPDLKVVTLRESSLHDVPAQLRALAESIERGDYGPVGSCGVAMLGNTFEAFCYGIDGAPPSVAMLFQAGVLRMAKSIEEHGKA